jgi:hypothetical protein
MDTVRLGADEHRVMRRALRRSVDVVPDARDAEIARLRAVLETTIDECASGLAAGSSVVNWQRVAERAVARSREALAE